jgi:4-hydroxy-3-methylbut-2-enyl diphosphate reductase
VKRAIKLAREAAKKHPGEVYTLGPLIHNPQAVAELERQGVRMVSSLKELEGKHSCTVIVRCHGVEPEVLERLEELDCRVVDATCPFVGKAQHHAARLAEEGYQVLVVGDSDHPEIVGILGHLKDGAEVVSRPEDLDGIELSERLGIIAQTTQTLQRLSDVVSAAVSRVRELKVINTICHATSERQEEALALAIEVDLMVIVGGRNSANTARLADICKLGGSRTLHIETADELDADLLADVDTVGITAGASTPNFIIEEVVEALRSLTAGRHSPRTGGQGRVGDEIF